jgi:DNA-binding transcriptional ArsR family regulator
MPFEVVDDPRRPLQVEVQPSAVLELTWLVTLLCRHSQLDGLDELAAPAAALRDELGAMWDDGVDCLADTSILAERIGALRSDEADTFLDGLERAAQLDNVGLELRSETPQVRTATLARLERLRRDPSLARRYAGVMRRIWDAVRPRWEETGRAVVLAVCADWTERLREGASIWDLLPDKHLARHSEREQLFNTRRRLVLSPMYFSSAGGFVVDMTAYVHVGTPAVQTDAEEVSRKESELIAGRLKVLSDGTRVALLRQLAHEPASVMDLARRFRLAQPTVSNHVRLLRDAGLLDSRKDGARVVYTVPRERLNRILEETRLLLIDY